MIRATLRGMLQRKLRLLLSGLAVVLGVMFVSGSLVLTDTLGRSFDHLFADVYQYTDVQVRGVPLIQTSEFEAETTPPPIPAEVVDRVAAVPGVASATGVVDADGARLLDSEGQPVGSFGPPQLGRSWSGEDELLQLREGRGPVADDEVAIDAALASTAGVAVGDRVTVLTPAERVEARLVGIFGFSGGRDTIGGLQMVTFTDRRAQELMLGQPDVWSIIEVEAADGVALERLRDDIAAALGPQYQVSTGADLAAEQADQLKEGLSFISNILLGFAGVAVFVGVFLIINTFSIIVAQRTRELALLRAIGAQRRQVIASVLTEAVIIGLVASLLGLAAGIGVGALLALVAGSFAELPLAGVALPAGAVIAALVVGVLVTVVAAVLPAYRASQVAPVAAMQQAATDQRPLTRLSVAGAVVLATGLALLALGLSGQAGIWAVLAGVLGCFVGVALLTPLVARPAATGLGRLFSWSVPGKLGRRNSGRNPRRTAITAAALMVGVALVAGVGVLVDSAKASFTELADRIVAADLVISGAQSGPRPPTFDPQALRQITELPQVAAAAGFYASPAEIDGDRTFLFAANDLAAAARILGLAPVEGELATLQTGQVAVDDRTADQRDLAVGDRIEVQLPRGEARQYEVVARYEWTPLFSGVLLPAEATGDFAIPQPTLGFVQLAPGASVEQVRPAVAELLTDSPEVSVTDMSAFVDQQAIQIDTVLTMIRILLALAILIAVLGIVNTLALSVLERTREFGLLRAVGLSRAATMRMITVESVVIALFGALLGVAVGAGLGAAVARALQDEGITRLVFPVSDFALYLVLAALVGVVAAVVPAIRAARVDVLRAIAYE